MLRQVSTHTYGLHQNSAVVHLLTQQIIQYTRMPELALFINNPVKTIKQNKCLLQNCLAHQYI